jgi:hypothetical protein
MEEGIAKTKPSFSFTVGQKLTDYFSVDTAGRDINNIDVHGKQYGLMAASKCFQKSAMLCKTLSGRNKKMIEFIKNQQ